MLTKRFHTIGGFSVLIAWVILSVAPSPGQTTQPIAPLHYYFEGQAKELDLDAGRLAVLFRSEAGQRDVAMPIDNLGLAGC